ncbi:MAG: hypothetical protein FJ279_09595 [Planctomycetes bacterium]|nr:hypothetical protein [Planctomycetota bacterium]
MNGNLLMLVALGFVLGGGWRQAQGQDVPLTAGGLTALPRETTEPVALVNAGFEQEWDGWGPSKQPAFSIVTTPGAAHSGKACLRFDAGQQTQFVPSVRQVLKDVEPGVHVLRFWLKTDNVGKKDDKNSGVCVSLEYYLQDGQRTWPSTQVFTGTRDWQQEELRVLIPPELKPGSVTISIHRYGGPSGGEAFFDDVSLERVRPPPVDAFLRYPNYRGYLPEDGPQSVRLWVRLNRDEPHTAAQVEVTEVATDKKVTVVELPPGAQEKVVEIDASQWPLGRYSLRPRLGGYQHPAYHIQKVSAAQRRSMAVWFDERQVLHLNGKPTFMLGFYNAQGFDDNYGRLDTLAEAQPNFHIDYMSWGHPLAQQREYQEQMQKRGLWLLFTANNALPGTPWPVWKAALAKELVPGVTGDTQENLDRYLTRLAEEMRKMPMHGGWYVMDERDLDRIAPTFHQYTVLRRADPDHPTYCCSNKPKELFLWRDAMDVFGLDPYPLFNMAAGRPLTMAAEWTRAGVEATQASRPLWMVIQFFQGWAKDRWPTQEELRTMSLMAITEGARGLFYWSFGVRGLKWVKDKGEQAEYWRRAVAVCKELKQLEAALIAPDAPQAVKAVSDPRIRWRARLADGKCYVFAYLPSDKFVSDPAQTERVEARFTLSNGQTVTRAFRPDFADWFAATMQ